MAYSPGLDGSFEALKTSSLENASDKLSLLRSEKKDTPSLSGISLCEFTAEGSVTRYLEKVISWLDRATESHTTSNEVRAAQPSCEAE